jgi:hypothetical protein
MGIAESLIHVFPSLVQTNWRDVEPFIVSFAEVPHSVGGLDIGFGTRCPQASSFFVFNYPGHASPALLARV